MTDARPARALEWLRNKAKELREKGKDVSELRWSEERDAIADCYYGEAELLDEAVEELTKIFSEPVPTPDSTT